MNTDKNKKKLEEEKKLIEDELSSLGRVDSATGQWKTTPEEQSAPEADENDMADRTEDYEERSSTMATLNTRLDDVDDALAKIQSGNYGICESCGKPIEEDRLEANPSARTCKSCMNKII